MNEIVTRSAGRIALPGPKCGISIRLATMADLPFLDSLQKQHNKALGYFPTKQFEGYIAMGGVLIAEEVVGCQLLVVGAERSSVPQLATNNQQPTTPTRLGYVISRDRYLKRDELGIIYQLCVAQGDQRKLIGASLIKAVFERSAYGCRLYCCWCAQDLSANYFWESLGFVPIAFRAGSDKKKRVHIFWQKRIVEGDETKYWYPFQTNSGAIRQDRLVFPIPPGVHWKDVQAVSLPGAEKERQIEDASCSRRAGSPSSERAARGSAGKPAGYTKKNTTKNTAPSPERRMCGWGVKPSAPPVQPEPGKKIKRAKANVAVKIDPKYLAAARELRDRWMEEVQGGRLVLEAAGKYEVQRMIDSPAAAILQALPGPRASAAGASADLAA